MAEDNNLTNTPPVTNEGVAKEIVDNSVGDYEDADWEENNNSALMEAMEDLDDRSRDIVQQRWLNEQKATLHELAAEYNISAERVRQIEKNAMDKIKEAMLANTHLQLD